MPSLYLYVFSFPRRKKDCLITVFLKTKGGFVNQNACKLFYLYNCVHLHRTLVYRSNWMILGCYYTKRFHDSYYLQRCTHLCLRINPVNLRVLVREKINISTAKLHYPSYYRISTKWSSDYWKNIQALIMWQETLCCETRCQVALHQ